MPKNETLNRVRTNTAAVNRACDRLRNRLISELSNNPAMHGSIAVTVQVSNGVIDRFRVTADETEKCEPAVA